MRYDYEVPGREPDAMVDAAIAAPECLGPRMTGEGFAGSAVALVESDRFEDFLAETARTCREWTELEPFLFVCRPSDGTSVTTEENTP